MYKVFNSCQGSCGSHNCEFENRKRLELANLNDKIDKTMADNESIENNIIYNETQLYLLGHKIFIMILKIVMLFAII